MYLFLILVVAVAAWADEAKFRPNCDHETTGFAEFNTGYCKFYQCDGGQQLRLVCNTPTNVHFNTMNAHIRSVLDNYQRRATQPGGTQPLLFLHLSGRHRPGYGHPFNVDQNLFGNAAQLIHRLTINTDYLSSIDRTVWSRMPSLKILNITVLDTDVTAVPTNFFAGADSLESLDVDFGAARDFNFTSKVIDLKSLRCFNLRGKKFVCDCAMMEFMRRSPAWRMTEDYENALLDDDTWKCGTHTGATCGAAIPVHNGKALNNFNFPDCPHVPFESTLLGVAPLAGSQVSCDYENLRVKLRNMGVVNHLDFRLNGDTSKQCEGTFKAGVIHFDAPVSECGTNVTIDRRAKSVFYQNKVVISRKQTGGSVISNPNAQTVSGKVVPIECKLNQYGDLSQQFQAPYQIYPKQHWDGRVRIKMDVLPTTSIWGSFAFDITLDTTTAGNWSMSVEDCWATPTNNPADVLRYDIIEKGCYKDPTIQMTSQSGDQYVRHTYTLDQFQFSSTQNAQVFIHCEVDPCQQRNGYCQLSPEERCAMQTPAPEPTVPPTTTTDSTTYTSQAPVTTTTEEPPTTSSEELTTIQLTEAVTDEETSTITMQAEPETTTIPTTEEPPMTTSEEFTTIELTEAVTDEETSTVTWETEPQTTTITVPTLTPVEETDTWELGKDHRFVPDPYVPQRGHQLLGHVVPGSVATKRKISRSIIR